jgi:hypothetical protein
LRKSKCHSSEGVRNIVEAFRERAADAAKAVRRILLPLFN